MGFHDFPKYQHPGGRQRAAGYLLFSQLTGFTPEQVASGIVLPVSSPDHHLFCFPTRICRCCSRCAVLCPSRCWISSSPDLRAIIELGYDRTGYADVPTPAALFPVTSTRLQSCPR